MFDTLISLKVTMYPYIIEKLLVGTLFVFANTRSHHTNVDGVEQAPV